MVSLHIVGQTQKGTGKNCLSRVRRCCFQCHFRGERSPLYDLLDVYTTYEHAKGKATEVPIALVMLKFCLIKKGVQHVFLRLNGIGMDCGRKCADMRLFDMILRSRCHAGVW